MAASTATPTIHVSIDETLLRIPIPGLSRWFDYDNASELSYVKDTRHVTLSGTVLNCTVSASVERTGETEEYLKALLDEAMYIGLRRTLENGYWKDHMRHARCGFDAEGDFWSVGARHSFDGDTYSIVPSHMAFDCGGLPSEEQTDQCMIKARMHLRATGLKALLVSQRDYSASTMEEMTALVDTAWVVPSGDNIVRFIDAMMFIIVPELSKRVHARRHEELVKAAGTVMEAHLSTLPEPSLVEAKKFFEYKEANLFPVILPTGDELPLPAPGSRQAARLGRPRELLLLPTGQRLVASFMPALGSYVCMWMRARMANNCLDGCIGQHSFEQRAAQYKQEFVALASAKPLLSPAIGAGPTGTGYGPYEEAYLPNDLVYLLPQTDILVTQSQRNRFNAAIEAKHQAVLDRAAAERRARDARIQQRLEMEKMEARLADEMRRLQVLDSRARAEEQAAKELAGRQAAAQPQPQQRSSKKAAVVERHDRRANEQYSQLETAAWEADKSADYQQGLARGRLQQELQHKRKLVSTLQGVLEAKRKQLGAEQEAREHKVPAPPTMADWFEGLVRGAGEGGSRGWPERVARAVV